VIVYRSKPHATLKRNFQITPGAKWLEMLLQHVPDRGEHLVRYYGGYSNRARGRRKAEMTDAEAAALPEAVPEQVDPEASRAARAAWARLIKKVYEADPLVCPHCGRCMRFLSVIEEPGGRAHPAPPGALGPLSAQPGPARRRRLAGERPDSADLRAPACHRSQALT